VWQRSVIGERKNPQWEQSASRLPSCRPSESHQNFLISEASCSNSKSETSSVSPSSTSMSFVVDVTPARFPEPPSSMHSLRLCSFVFVVGSFFSILVVVVLRDCGCRGRFRFLLESGGRSSRVECCCACGWGCGLRGR